MKKLLALLLTLVMCLSLAACGGSGTDTSGTDTSSGETGEDSGDSSYRVAMICSASQKPKNRHASSTPAPLHRPKITAARAMKPRPATLPST